MVTRRHVTVQWQVFNELYREFIAPRTVCHTCVANLAILKWLQITFSISISQIFRSWVAISQLRPPMASLFRSLYDMAGLAPRICVLRNICFHRVSATGMASRQGTLTPPDIWSRPFGTCICSTCWDQSFFRTCRYFSGLCSSNIPRYFLDFVSFWGRRDFQMTSLAGMR